jgi:hypothetical protein
MLISSAGRRGLLVALCCMLLSGAALANEPAEHDETTLLVRTSAGASERIRFEGELAPGESRALSTEAGNPATLSRTDSGMLLELAGERFEIDVPAAAALDAAALEGEPEHSGKRIIIHDVETQAAADGTTPAPAHERKIVRIIRHADGSAGGVAGDPAHEMPDEAELVLPEGEGPQVVVMRRIVRHPQTQ